MNPTFGTSLLLHILLIIFGKTKNLFYLFNPKINKTHFKISPKFEKLLIFSLTAVIIISISAISASGSFMAIETSIESPASNYKIIKIFIEELQKTF